MTDLQGHDYIARVRLSNAENETIAEVGATCEHVPPAPGEDTPSAALARLLASRKIAPKAEAVPDQPVTAAAQETAWTDDLGRPAEHEAV